MVRIAMLLFSLAMALLIGGCVVQPVMPESAAPPAAEAATPTPAEDTAPEPSPFTVEILSNLAYTLDVDSAPVQLTDGSFEDEANQIHVSWIDTYALGDLNGEPSAAVVLSYSGGGSGQFSYLAVVQEQDGTPVNVASTLLGDRVTFNWITIDNNQIVIDFVTQGPDDPMCCATQRTSVNYLLEGNQLVEGDVTVIGTQPQLSETSVITYIPETTPTESQVGSCFTNAIGLGRTDAWRCTTEDNVIHDPCFQIDDAPTVVCDADPVTGESGFVLELSEPLPAPDPGQASYAWLVQLGDGTVCGLLTGTVPAAGDQVAPYGCADEAHTNLVETFITDSPVWFAQRVAITVGDEGFSVQSSVLTPVATVWR
jgi:hypothetical protein